MGLAVWTEDESGPYQAAPYPGGGWRPEGDPARHPHEYIRGGAAKLLTLLHPSDGEVRVKGVTSSANAVLHPWIEEEPAAILATLPEPEAALSPDRNRALWERWQEGLSVKVTLSAELPPLRMLLVLDNLAGHKTPEMVLWLFEHGVMPLYTPLGGSWLGYPLGVGRVGAAHTRAQGAGRTAPDDARGDHGMAGGDGARLERGPDAVRVGRQAQGEARSSADPAPRPRGRRRSRAPTGPAPSERRRRMAIYVTSDPLVQQTSSYTSVETGAWSPPLL